MPVLWYVAVEREREGWTLKRWWANGGFGCRDGAVWRGGGSRFPGVCAGLVVGCSDCSDESDSQILTNQISGYTRWQA